jgi:hypothetical protein
LHEEKIVRAGRKIFGFYPEIFRDFMMERPTFIHFVEAINQHDLDTIYALLTVEKKSHPF